MSVCHRCRRHQHHHACVGGACVCVSVVVISTTCVQSRGYEQCPLRHASCCNTNGVHSAVLPRPIPCVVQCDVIPMPCVVAVRGIISCKTRHETTVTMWCGISSSHVQGGIVSHLIACAMLCLVYICSVWCTRRDDTRRDKTRQDHFP